jgi:hypothetical protein
MTFNKSSAQIRNLVYKTWFSRHPYNNGSKFKLHFRALCNTYGITRKPISVKNPQENAIPEHIHAIVMNMVGSDEIDAANLVKLSDINFFPDAAWAICSNHHTVLKASPGAAIFGRDMLFDNQFIADWKKIREHRQLTANLNTAHKNEGRIDYDYQAGQKVLVRYNCIFCKAESRYPKEPWTITSVHQMEQSGFNVVTNLKG